MQTTLCLATAVGKLPQAAVDVASAVANNSGGHTCRLFVQDMKTRLKFLVDSGADVSIIPSKSKCDSPNKDFVLFAANGSQIPTYGVQTLNMDLGLRRQFQWPFIVAKVSRGIIGADFNLLIDLKNKNL